MQVHQSKVSAFDNNLTSAEKNRVQKSLEKRWEKGIASIAAKKKEISHYRYTMEDWKQARKVFLSLWPFDPNADDVDFEKEVCESRALVAILGAAGTGRQGGIWIRCFCRVFSGRKQRIKNEVSMAGDGRETVVFPCVFSALGRVASERGGIHLSGQQCARCPIGIGQMRTPR